jgi:hypothetical protein
MADPDHSAESYRLLFVMLGAGMVVLVLVFILASALVMPLWAVAVLVAVWAVVSFLAFAARERRPWLPLAAGTALAVVWIVALTVGSAVFDWRP